MKASHEEIKAPADGDGPELRSQDAAFRDTEYAENETVHAALRAPLGAGALVSRVRVTSAGATRTGPGAGRG